MGGTKIGITPMVLQAPARGRILHMPIRLVRFTNRLIDNVVDEAWYGSVRSARDRARDVMREFRYQLTFQHGMAVSGLSARVTAEGSLALNAQVDGIAVQRTYSGEPPEWTTPHR